MIELKQINFKKNKKKSQPALIFEIGYFGHEFMTNPMATKRKSKSAANPVITGTGSG
jgi:hypothetical protein